MRRVLVSQRNPEELGVAEQNLLQHFFGPNVVLERTEIGPKDKGNLSALERPIVLPVTMEVKWGWLLMKSSQSGRPEASVVVQMPDGFRMALVAV